MAPTINWQSPLIPQSIRRPWRIYEEDLEDSFVANIQGKMIKNSLATLSAQPFYMLPRDMQQTYADVSLTELSAYACWRQAQVARPCGSIDRSTTFEALWESLGGNDKAAWIPKDPLASLTADSAWAPLLFNGSASPTLEAGVGAGTLVEGVSMPIKAEAALPLSSMEASSRTDAGATPVGVEHASCVTAAIADKGAAHAAAASADAGTVIPSTPAAWSWSGRGVTTPTPMKRRRLVVSSSAGGVNVCRCSG